MPDASTIKVHFYILAVSIIGDADDFLLGCNGTVQGIFKFYNLSWSADKWPKSAVLMSSGETIRCTNGDRCQ